MSLPITTANPLDTTINNTTVSPLSTSTSITPAPIVQHQQQQQQPMNPINNNANTSATSSFTPNPIATMPLQQQPLQQVQPQVQQPQVQQPQAMSVNMNPTTTNMPMSSHLSQPIPAPVPVGTAATNATANIMNMAPTLTMNQMNAVPHTTTPAATVGVGVGVGIPASYQQLPLPNTNTSVVASASTGLAAAAAAATTGNVLTKLVATPVPSSAVAAAGGGGTGPNKDEFEEIREQDRYLPIANIARIMKNTLPENAKIAKDSKETVQECVSEFISFITSEASDKCMQEKRKTINGDDLLWAMSTLGFDKYVEPLKIYLTKYREAIRGDKPDSKKSKESNIGKDGSGTASASQLGRPSVSASTAGGSIGLPSNIQGVPPS